MDLGSLKKAAGSTKENKRIGRGQGSGTGGTAGRGHKGQRSRSGSKRRPWFEGGQMPIQRRLPKFGFYQHGKVVFQVVNVSDLEQIKADGEITPDMLLANGLISKTRIPIKLLGYGEISKKVSIQVHAASKTAREKIEKSGGVVTLL